MCQHSSVQTVSFHLRLKRLQYGTGTFGTPVYWRLTFYLMSENDSNHFTFFIKTVDEELNLLPIQSSCVLNVFVYLAYLYFCLCVMIKTINQQLL